MKNVIFINGVMGSGKTTTAKALQQRLNNSVFVDGDWCWDMHPFVVNEARKALVIKNIQALLQNFVDSQEYDSIIFCWVMDEQSIIDRVLEHIQIKDYHLSMFTLMIDENHLKERIQKDIDRNIRSASSIEKSIARLPKLQQLHTIKIDVSTITAKQAAIEIASYLE